MKRISIFATALLLGFSGCSMGVDNDSREVNNYSGPSIKKSDEQPLGTADLSPRSKSGDLDCGKVIYNPDMGFYCLQSVTVTSDGVSNLEEIQEDASKKTKKVSEGDYAYKSNYKFDLVHIEFDISAFSGRVNKKNDLELTPAALNDIRTVLGYYRAAEKTVIVRFAYDPEYKGEKIDKTDKYVEIEPLEWSTVISHVNALCPILKDYADIITAVECGMLGPYGEMHGTIYAEGDKDGKLRGYIVDLMKTFIAGLKGTDLPLLVRQPRFIYCYITDNTTYNGHHVPSAVNPVYGDDLYRIGLYNDGYLDEESDSGTFKTDDGREAEIAFLEPFTNHTPYGGEMIGIYDLENGITQFENVHLSFLNIGWNANFFTKLDNGTYMYNGENMFKYLLKHMGYRYVLTSSSFDYYDDDKTFGINLSFKNNGFANLPYHRRKTVKLYFVPAGTEPTGQEKYINTTGDLFTGQNKISVKADVSSIEKGRYDVYARICDDDGKFSIELANDIWNPELRANKIGTFEK